jgi:hypothetical protein
MNRNFAVLPLCFAAVFITSCSKKSESTTEGIGDSAAAGIDTTSITPGLPEFPNCLHKPGLAAILPCAIMELALDGNLEEKKRDCLDSLNGARNNSVLRADSIFRPVYLPNLLEENALFKKRFAVSVVVAGDSQNIAEKFSNYRVELKSEFQGWRVSVAGWLDSVEAANMALNFSKIAGVEVDAQNKAKGAVALGVCLSAQDSIRFSNSARSNGIPLIFARISYSGTDADNLLITESAEE